MSNALHLKSVKNTTDLHQKVKILKAKYIKDFQVKFEKEPMQHEKDQLENLAILKITFDDILDRIKKGRDHKREYLSILARYEQLVNKIFGSKATKAAKEDGKDSSSIWDSL